MSVRLMTKGREVKNLELYVTRSEAIRILSIALLQAFGLVWNHQDYVQKIILTKQHTNLYFLEISAHTHWGGYEVPIPP